MYLYGPFWIRLIWFFLALTIKTNPYKNNKKPIVKIHISTKNNISIRNEGLKWKITIHESNQPRLDHELNIAHDEYAKDNGIIISKRIPTIIGKYAQIKLILKIIDLNIDFNLYLKIFFLFIGNLLAQNRSDIKDEINIVNIVIICISSTSENLLNQKNGLMKEI